VSVRTGDKNSLEIHFVVRRGLDAPSGIEELQANLTIHFIHAAKKTYLSFAKYLYSQGVAQGIDPDKWGITYTKATQNR